MTSNVNHGFRIPTHENTAGNKRGDRMRKSIVFGMGIGICIIAALSGCGGSSGSTGEAAPAALQTQAMVNGGGSHTLMLKEDGTVWSWGDNSNGQLGSVTTSTQTTPESPILTDVAAVAAGGTHSLALKKDGTVYGWGDSRYGQAGDPGPRGIVSIVPDPGSISFAVDSSVTLTNSFYNSGAATGGNLQIGGSPLPPPKRIGNPPVLGVLPPRIMFPLQIPGLTGVVAVAAGADHSLALKSDGTVWAWGRNSSGQLGVATTGEQSVVPVKASCPVGMIAIAAGTGHSVALLKDGTVWAWGDNTYGQMGGGTGGTSLTPHMIPGLEGVIAIASGGDHVLALKRDGSLWAWGRNSSGQLGNNSTTDNDGPVRVPLSEPVLGTAGGGNHSVAVTKSGHVWAWGDNSAWQVGGGSYEGRILTPRVVAGVDSVKAVAAGKSNTIVLKGDGTYLGWGNNVYGQLGDGTRGCRRRPVAVEVTRPGTIIMGGDWGGRDLTPGDGDILAGTFTNVGRFVITNGDVVGYGPGAMSITAASIDIDGSFYSVPQQTTSNLTLNAVTSFNLRAGSELVSNAGTISFTAGTLTFNGDIVSFNAGTGTTIVNSPGNLPVAGGSLTITAH